MQIKFSVNGQIQLSRNLRLVGIQLKDLQPFIKDTLEIVHQRSNEVFRNAGKNVEKNPVWAPLSERTIKYKMKKYGKVTPLINTGRLKNDTLKFLMGNTGYFKYNAPYAIYHQSGGRYLPKRAIIDLNNATNRKIIKSLQTLVYRKVGIFGKQA